MDILHSITHTTDAHRRALYHHGSGCPPSHDSSAARPIPNAVTGVRKRTAARKAPCADAVSLTATVSDSSSGSKKVTAQLVAVHLKIPLRPPVPQVKFDVLPNVDDAITVCRPTHQMAGIRLKPGTALLVQGGAKLEYRIRLQLLRVELDRPMKIGNC